MDTCPTSRITRIVAVAAVTMCAAGCTASPPLEEWTLGLEEITTIGGTPIGAEASFRDPEALGFDDEGNVFVLDVGTRRVQVFRADGTHIRSISTAAFGRRGLVDPIGMFVHPDGRVWVVDAHNHRVQPYGIDGRPRMPMELKFSPRDLVVSGDLVFVQRAARTGPSPTTDQTPMIVVLDHSGRLVGGLVDPISSPDLALGALENGLVMSAAPEGGVAVANTHFSSRIRVYRDTGVLAAEIAVLYKAGAWAPLGRRPIDVNEASLDRLAHTCSGLAWDQRRRIFWVLAGYVDRTAANDWIIGREIYRYGADGTYRGSLMLPHRATTLAIGPDGRLWTIDVGGIVHAFRLTDPDMQPVPSSGSS